MTKVSHDSETPAYGQQVITACALVHHTFDGVVKVFLAKRAETKKFLPGIYELPGGHVDFGEDIVDGLKREIAEELGMTVKVGDPFAAFTYENAIKGSHSIEVIYFAQFIEPLEHITLQPEDHSRYDWLTKKELIQRRAEMLPTEHAKHQHGDDAAEYDAVIRSFALLDGQALNFG